MNVIEFTEARPGVKLPTLQKEAAHRAERLFAFLPTDGVECFDYRAIEKSHLELRASILQNG